MNVKEIINMVNEDLAEISNEEYVSIEQLVTDYRDSLRNNDSQWTEISKKLQATIATNDGMRQILGFQDALELSKVLVDIGRRNNNEDEKVSRNIFVDIAYLLCYRYFESHDMLERYFASLEIIGILQKSGDLFTETYKAMVNWASSDVLTKSIIEPIDYTANKHVLFGQVILAFAPYILAMQKIYPNLVNQHIAYICQHMVDSLHDSEKERLGLLPKMELLADFIEKDWKLWIKESNVAPKELEI